MKKKILLSFLCTMLISFAFGQSNETAAKKEPAAEGTFQIISKGKTRQVFTVDNFKKIQLLVSEQRKENEELIIQYNEFTEIRILSKKEIEQTNFKAVETFISSEK